MALSEYSFIAESLEEIRATLAPGVDLVAVSKTHPVEALQAAYNAGQRIFGENKVQEMTMKQSLLPNDIEWHFIGHVQKNKIKMMAPYVSVIQGVDNFEKLVEIDKQAKKYDRNIKCLLQIHIAAEDTKFGFSPQECLQMLETTCWQELSNITIAGVMGMATFTDNLQQVKQEFETLVALFNNIKQRYFAECDSFSMISAGMSDDYQIAMDAGSNLVRIGSSIFGARDYSK
jgi:pyridoxal phosphate enzyme (YggS family)